MLASPRGRAAAYFDGQSQKGETTSNLAEEEFILKWCDTDVNFARIRALWEAHVKIPPGIKFLGTVSLLWAATLLGLWAVAVKHPQQVEQEVQIARWIPVIRTEDLLLLPITGTIALLLGLGLLFLRKGARGILLFLCGLPLASWPVGLLFAFLIGEPLDGFFAPRMAINLAWNGWVCWYLNRENVKRAFLVSEPYYEDLDMIAEESASSRAGRPIR